MKFSNFLNQLQTKDNFQLLESVYRGYQLLNESVNYPNGFDITEFGNLPSYAARTRYAESKLTKVGKGSARTVYQIDEDTVLKIAHNKKGVAQNEIESDWSMHNYHGNLLPDLIETDDDNNMWLVKQRANRIKKSEFKQMTGHTFQEFSQTLRARADDVNGVRYKTPYPGGVNVEEDYFDDEFFNELMSLISTYDLEAGDMQQISNWGRVKDNEDPILTDVGLTRSVYKEHYAR